MLFSDSPQLILQEPHAPREPNVNQGLVIAVFVALVALVLFQPAIGKAMAGLTGPNRSAAGQRARRGDRQMLSETVECRTSTRPQAALAAIEARLSAAPDPVMRHGDVRLTEKTPTCLRYTVSNRTAMFLEVVVAAAPWGAGSTVTIDVVRWLDSDKTPTVAENLEWLREDVEAALRSADPGIEVLVHAND